MDKRQRLTLLGIAVAIAAVVAVIALVSSGGGDGEKTDSTQAADTQPQTQSTTTPDAPAKAPEVPEPEVIRVKGGEVVGGTAEIELEKGERALIDVRADAADEAHLHGYDIVKEVGPGKTAKFRFKANLEGIYELELHNTGAQLAQVKVKP